MPPEILMAICGQLCYCCTAVGPRDYRIPRQQYGLPTEKPCFDYIPKFTLSQLSKTCRILHEIAQPFLYHYVCGRASSTRIACLIRTLSSRPKLGQHVRWLDMDVPYQSHDRFWDHLSKQGPLIGEADWIGEAARQLGPWPWRFDEGCFDGRMLVLCILLLLTPNIRVLNVPGFSGRRMETLKKYLGCTASISRLTLPRLETLNMMSTFTARQVADVMSKGHWCRRPPQPDFFLGLAPNLSTLCMREVISRPTDAFTQRIPHIQTLILGPYNHTTSETLGKLLELSPHLERLALHRGFADGPENTWADRQTAGQLWDLLWQRSATLRDISLDTTEMGGGEAAPEIKALCSLQDFPKLKVLRVDPRTLRAVMPSHYEAWPVRETFPLLFSGVLPPTLKELVLWLPRWGDDFLELGKWTSPLRRGSCESLEKVIVAPVMKCENPLLNVSDLKGPFPEAAAEMKVAFAEMGVEFDVMNSSGIWWSMRMVKCKALDSCWFR
ncbi:hypothetical protein QBC47DRAFT_357689 [Echria macrotheca]|uniref:F-box domain-containing protein n=1 Tax=Echria macrotheca TaxID=438768 RepID=A0AAJ0F963_9PEZI|nr:hypothetical protein QBC47DRAFT_357689 [Echria macrotheca]